jgi:hypothetical protein
MMAIVGWEKLRTTLIDQGKLLFDQDGIGVMLLTERALVTCWSTAIEFLALRWFPPPGSIEFADLSTFRAHRSCFPLLQPLGLGHIVPKAGSKLHLLLGAGPAKIITWRKLHAPDFGESFWDQIPGQTRRMIGLGRGNRNLPASQNHHTRPPFATASGPPSQGSDLHRWFNPSSGICPYCITRPATTSRPPKSLREASAPPSVTL